MANDPLILEGANLFCGNANPDASNHLVLAELRLPAFEENYINHAPGGAPVAIEIDTHLNRFEAGFNLHGWQPQVLRLIGKHNQIFTAYGLLRRRQTGGALEAKAVMQGRLGRAAPGPFARGTLQGYEYAIRGIMHYELTIAGEQLFNWDFLTARSRTMQSPAELLRTLLPGALEM